MQTRSSRQRGDALARWNSTVLALVLIGLLSAAVALSEQPGAIRFQPTSVSLAGVLVVLGGMVGCAIAGGASDVHSRARDDVLGFLSLAAVLFGACAIAFAMGVGIVVAVSWAASGTPPDTPATASLPWLLVRTWWGVSTLAALGYAAAIITRRRTAGIGFIVALVIGEQLLALSSFDLAHLAPISAAAAVARGSAGAATIAATAIYLAGALALTVVAHPETRESAAQPTP